MKSILIAQREVKQALKSYDLCWQFKNKKLPVEVSN